MASKNAISQAKTKSNNSSKSKNTRETKVRSSKAKGTATKSETEKVSRIIDDDEEKALGPEKVREIYLFVYLAIAIFMLCANFGICGVAGNAISGLFFGLFGRIQYIIPVYFFLSLAFILANGPRKSVIRKIIWSGVALLITAAVFQLASGFDKVTAKSLFLDGYDKKTGGGLLAGGIVVLLNMLISKVGVMIILVVLTFVTIIEVTNVSLVSFIKNLNPANHYYEDDEEAEAYDEMEIAETNPKMKRRGLLSRIEVLDDPNKDEDLSKTKAKNKKKKENKIVPEEEVHELKIEASVPDPFNDTNDDIIDGLKSSVVKDKKTDANVDEKTDGDEPVDHLEGLDIPEVRHISLPSAMSITSSKQKSAADELSKLDIPKVKRNDSVIFDLTPSSETYDDPLTDKEADVWYDERTGTASDHNSGSLADGFNNDPSSDADYIKKKEDYDLAYDMDNNDSYDASYKAAKRDQTESDNLNNSSRRVQTASGMIIDRDETNPSEIPNEVKVTKKDKEQETMKVENEISSQNAETVKVYKFPPTSLLKRMKNNAGDQGKSVRETQIRLSETLKSFGVNVTMIGVSQGPAVTRYEMQPDVGVKVSKILSLQDDIKLALAATDIRIEAPIPGKSAIGIEVPNKVNTAVSGRELLESPEFREASSKISFAVGKDIAGKTVVGNLAKMPHLLIAGQTGSGKSVCINTIIMSILFKARPDEVRMIMIDPKQVELAPYNGIPHLLIPVVTDPKKAAGALNWAVVEMTKRYQLFAKYNVRNIEGYNKKLEENPEEFVNDLGDEARKMPLIVVIVDELADLMMVAHGEVEDSIVRLSQLARAAGIHLIIATQRPSVDVITGLIKVNVPSRIAFSVSSGVDSRTIIDMVGAEKLLGHGDMLYYPTGYSKPVRVQGAFVSDDEINSVTDFIKNNFEGNGYDSSISDSIENSSESLSSDSGDNQDDNRYDELFEDAAKLVIEKDKASIGNLQRMFRIGFNRAARIMDQLCEAGVVGEEEGTKPRRVLMTMTEFEEKYSVK